MYIDYGDLVEAKRLALKRHKRARRTGGKAKGAHLQRSLARSSQQNQSDDGGFNHAALGLGSPDADPAGGEGEVGVESINARALFACTPYFLLHRRVGVWLIEINS